MRKIANSKANKKKSQFIKINKNLYVLRNLYKQTNNTTELKRKYKRKQTYSSYKQRINSLKCKIKIGKKGIQHKSSAAMVFLILRSIVVYH